MLGGLSYINPRHQYTKHKCVGHSTQEGKCVQNCPQYCSVIADFPANNIMSQTSNKKKTIAPTANFLNFIYQSTLPSNRTSKINKLVRTLLRKKIK